MYGRAFGTYRLRPGQKANYKLIGIWTFLYVPKARQYRDVNALR